eukprot:TRINITY_DN8390_c0_g1_i1.p1 TRINITY_DN8390_c0_g1~~TRINITY_DN8390_c0_g1_i1.p1  ORF type:complete len:318 (-),score=57.49 TRINITY_DN8390_c0_g1_i1:114-1067(-)
MSSRMFKRIEKTLTAFQTLEGAGFPVREGIGRKPVGELDPFLLLHHMGPVTYAPGKAVGAPWHPHRGFETVTYFLQGQGRHSDSLGNRGYLNAGDVQWMSAGSGIIHDEGPSEGMKTKGGTMEGFQIWVNLPASQKFSAPKYQDLPRDRIPEYKGENYLVRVIAGEVEDVKAITQTTTPIYLLDFRIEKNAKAVTQKIPVGFNSCIYVYRGTALFGEEKKEASEGDVVVFTQSGDNIKVELPAESASGVKFLLLAGQPIGEPVERKGPFVLNTREQLRQAFEDYYNGTLASVPATFTIKSAASIEDYDPQDPKFSIV